jgi:hypothetical protein
MEQVSLCIRGFCFKTLWFETVDEEHLGVLDQRKQVKRQWVQDRKQSSVDNLKNVRREASRHFRNKKKEYLQAKIEKLGLHDILND